MQGGCSAGGNHRGINSLFFDVLASSNQGVFGESSFQSSYMLFNQVVAGPASYDLSVSVSGLSYLLIFLRLVLLVIYQRDRITILSSY